MTSMPDHAATRPNRLPWPPLIYGAALVAGLGLQAFVPVGWPAAVIGWPLRGTGVLVAAAGLGFDFWALHTLRRAHTNILPHRAADHLVTHGPFALTRNPIYLGNTLLVLGIGLVLSNAWLMGAALVAAFATDRLAARREEWHLAAKFGPAFTSYAARVPRWIGRPRPIPQPPGGWDRS
ncbi:MULTISPECIES: methyltransferase family protein [unclassified Xanthobacter]|uniref:methyltransferase family protein n=1 Tax=unclassified Xanthobacter TaxID=2623496 RepID=UPI001EDE5D35|nr:MULTISPECIES: isoprenylcysteine carboxylmethyltransferase family protein [unclassified Xanthobacter]